MDDRSDILSTPSFDGALGEAVGKLLSRPDLIANIASELGFSSSRHEEAAAEEKSREVQSVTEIAVDRGRAEPVASRPAAEKDVGDNRKRLLVALRPYMSQSRREAIDMLINLESVGKLIGNIDPQTLTKLFSGGKNV